MCMIPLAKFCTVYRVEKLRKIRMPTIHARVPMPMNDDDTPKTYGDAHSYLLAWSMICFMGTASRIYYQLQARHMA